MATKPAKPATAKPATTKPAAKPDVAEVAEAAPKKGKKKLVIIVVVLLLIGGGAAAFLLMMPAHTPKNGAAAAATEAAAAEARASKNPPTFVDLGTFTANLLPEEGDRYLQATISLKLAKPDLAEKIKANSPEILHRINMLLQSKRPSELATFTGKEILSRQIKGQVEYVMGMRKTAPPIDPEQIADAPPEMHSSDITEVLFTSFIIQ
jgi:flagellar FliL protein